MIDSTTRHGILATLALRRLAPSATAARAGRPSPFEFSVLPRTARGGRDVAPAPAARIETTRRRTLRPSSVM
jgi:hypothetical protein